MRVYIAIDMEGVAGVVNNEEGARGNPEYERARRLMTAEASAAVAGIFDAAPDAQVTVADSHGTYRNLIPEELDERATINRGKPRLHGMVDGIDRGYDIAMLLGVHGRAGAAPAVLSHTHTGNIFEVRVNGKPFGELAMNAALAGAHGVPVVLVAGDQTVAEEARDLLGGEVVTVKTKESRGNLTAECLHPRVSQRKIREAAAWVVRERPNVPPLKVQTPVDVEVVVVRPVFADFAELIENVKRMDGRTIRFTRPDMPAVYRIVRLIAELSRVPI
ncbi:MAG: M55 family metallopeptidase [Chloroflexi bacterium]|nr:M55 family metallopeptidase [Chloroflexota bacterium]